MMESWAHSAEILNAHFHAICRGPIPLFMHWDEDAKREAEVDDQALEFITHLKHLASSRGMCHL